MLTALFCNHIKVRLKFCFHIGMSDGYSCTSDLSVTPPRTWRVSDAWKTRIQTNQTWSGHKFIWIQSLLFGLNWPRIPVRKMLRMAVCSSGAVSYSLSVTMIIRPYPSTATASPFKNMSQKPRRRALCLRWSLCFENQCNQAWSFDITTVVRQHVANMLSQLSLTIF